MDPSPYGEAIEVFDRVGTCVLTERQGSEHLIPQKYLGSELEFREIDAIYGNEAARDLYDNSYEKRALRNYFNRKGIKGELSPEEQKDLYGGPIQSEVWQVYGLERGSLVNAVAKGEYVGGDYTRVGIQGRPPDFAVIISKAADRAERSLLLFRFDENKVDEFVAALDLRDYPNYYLRPVTYGSTDFLFDTFVTLDPIDPSRVDDFQKGLLLEKESQTGVKYLVELKEGELSLAKLRKTILGYKLEATVF